MQREHTQISNFQTRTTKSFGRTTQQQLSTINKDDLTIEVTEDNITPTHIGNKKAALDRSKLGQTFGDSQLASFATIQPSTVLFTPTHLRE